MELDDNKLRKLFASVSCEGKDYLTDRQAAHYLSIGLTRFYEIRTKYGLMPHDFEGKVLYRKADLKAIQEREAKPWQDFAKGAARGRSTGM